MTCSRTQDIEEALRSLKDCLERYNVLVRRVRASDTAPDLAVLTMSKDHALDTEVIAGAEVQSCTKSASRNGRLRPLCTEDKKCSFCKWNARRTQSLARREEERKAYAGDKCEVCDSGRVWMQPSSEGTAFWRPCPKGCPDRCIPERSPP